MSLFLVNEYEHFMPEADSCGDLHGIQIRKLDIPGETELLNKQAQREIKSKLAGFDLYFGSEIAPAILSAVGKRTDYFIPIGTDLTSYPFYSRRRGLPYVWEYKKWMFSALQRFGIANSGFIFMVANGDPYYEESLRKLQFQGKRITKSLPLIYTKAYEHCSGESEALSQIIQFREMGYLLGVSTSRIEFSDHSSEHYKGTDVLLKGFADFMRQSSRPAVLYLLEYGNDIQQAKALIVQLNLQDHVVWLPKQRRKDLMQMLPHFHIGFGNLGRAAVMYNVVMEFIASGLPVFQKGTEDEKPYPYSKIESFEGLTAAMLDYVSADSGFIQEAIVARNWFLETAVNQPLQDLKETLDTKSTSENKWTRSFLLLKLKLGLFFVSMIEQPRLFFKYRILGLIK